MREKKLLYLCRVDVLPSSDDHVLNAPLDATVSQTVQTGRVTVRKSKSHVLKKYHKREPLTRLIRQKLYAPRPVPPGISDSLTGFLTIIPVAFHHTVASDHQLS